MIHICCIIYFPFSPVCHYCRFTWLNLDFLMKISLLAAAAASELLQYLKHTLLRDNLLRRKPITDNFQVNVF